MLHMFHDPISYSDVKCVVRKRQLAIVADAISFIQFHVAHNRSININSNYARDPASKDADWTTNSRWPGADIEHNRSFCRDLTHPLVERDRPIFTIIGIIPSNYIL